MSNLEEHCVRINTKISISDKRAAMKNATDVLCFFTDALKRQDPAFASLYRGHKITGSYADDLKISFPNEFDFLLIVKLPLLKQFKVGGVGDLTLWYVMYFLPVAVSIRYYAAVEGRAGLRAHRRELPAAPLQPAQPATRAGHGAQVRRCRRVSDEEAVLRMDPLAAGSCVRRSDQVVAQGQGLLSDQHNGLHVPGKNAPQLPLK